jgi:hypothetical protein
MTPAEALQVLADHGVTIKLIGDELDIDIPEEFNTAEWLAWFREAKPCLIAYLGQQSGNLQTRRNQIKV